VYRFVDDNIEYKVVVVDMGDKANDAATLLGEAEYMFQEGKKVLMDTFGHVDREYGRKLTIDLPNNAGRSSAAFYFINGRIVSLQATILPANGDYNTPEMGRFVDSVTFFTVLAPDDAIELPAPPKWRQARHLADEDLPWRRTGRQFKGGRNAQMDAGGQARAPPLLGNGSICAKIVR
jgi:hypothetical protein